MFKVAYKYVLCRGSHATKQSAISHTLHLCRKGTNGVNTNGVTATFTFLTEGLFGVLPLTYFYLPNSARAYLFSSVCRNSLPAPLVLTPFVRNQQAARAARAVEGLLLHGARPLIALLPLPQGYHIINSFFTSADLFVFHPCG